MSETTTQANHELLLGIGRDMKTITRALEMLSQQLLDLGRMAGPPLGLCTPHVADWIDAGGDTSVPLPSAQAVILVQGVGQLPVCIGHFRAMKAATRSSELLVPTPGMPQTPEGLIVPGRP